MLGNNSDAGHYHKLVCLGITLTQAITSYRLGDNSSTGHYRLVCLEMTLAQAITC